MKNVQELGTASNLTLGGGVYNLEYARPTVYLKEY